MYVLSLNRGTLSTPFFCPAECFETYTSRTVQFRSRDSQELLVLGQLFLGISLPHTPVKACSTARWVKSSAGIDTKTFLAHSTRGAATSKALETGATRAAFYG